ncbi:hypothetical protein [Changpingibacter yushuensis]|uniref:hypothetical protein n=1 Tax=Changpingibacter yushuensis TaxID=2758440 RepID=UPI00165E8218|nr:hypothetical protein [Changpingibacter yushuensis]
MRKVPRMLVEVPRGSLLPDLKRDCVEVLGEPITQTMTAAIENAVGFSAIRLTTSSMVYMVAHFLL